MIQNLTNKIQEAVNKIINENTIPELLSYELVDKIKKTNLIKIKNEEDLVSNLEEVIFKHTEEEQAGTSKTSLAVKLAKALNR